MFDGCCSLLSLNISNFDTSKVTNFDWMFDGCNSLIYLNLNSFIIQNNASIYKIILPRNLTNISLCYNTNLASTLASYLKDYSNNCDNKCFQKAAKLIIDNIKCIDECDNDNIYKYEYKNICFKTCSEISEFLYGNSTFEIYYNYNKTKCIDEIPDGYYLMQ